LCFVLQLSMAIAMVAEQREVYSILSEIFSVEGNELYLRPVHWFIKEDSHTSFNEVAYIAKQKGQLAFGYKLQSGEQFINPRDKHCIIEWAEGDVLLIMAED
jgi:hypothetical protein